MAVVHEAAVRNSIADTVLAAVGNAGYLRFETSGDAEVSTHTFPTPSGTVAGATLTFDCDPDISDTSPAGGTIAQASIYTSGATKILECSAGTATSNDITVSSVTIATTDTVTLTALTYVAPT